MDGPIRVYEYSKGNLLDLFQGDPKIISKELITKKTHFEYFNEYLKSKDMEAKTIVVETHYIDRDFLEDLKINMPRFLWRATALYMRNPVMDLLFDATDIEQGNLFLCGIVYHQEIFSAIRLLVTSHKNASNNFRKHPSGKALLEWLKNWAG